MKAGRNAARFVIAGFVLAIVSVVPVASAEDYVVCQPVNGGTVCAGVTNIRLVCATIDGEPIMGHEYCDDKEPTGPTHIFAQGPG